MDKKIVLFSPNIEPYRNGTQSIQELEGILRTAGVSGIVEITSHFKIRCALRSFTVVEALNVLRRGSILEAPEFCPEFCNWKFVVSADHDLGVLHVVAAVAGGQQQKKTWSNSVVLITGYIR